MTIIVTDGEQRAALAVVRSLGRAGHRVVVCSTRPTSLAGASRHSAHTHQTASPIDEPDRFVSDVLECVARYHADLIVPISEPAVLAVLEKRDLFPVNAVPFPTLDAFRQVCDKKAVLEAAESVGISVPRQRTILTPDADVPELTYPVVVKPARSVADVGETRLKTSVAHAANEKELVEILKNMHAAAYPILLQERITGPGSGVFMILWNGRIAAAMAHRRLREKPPSGGVSVYRESIPIDPALLERSAQLLMKFGWQGPAMVEYKIDSSTGKPYLMEINGRFWGSLQLAIDAGMDFPNILAELAVGKHSQKHFDYVAGVRSRWWWGDVDHLLLRLTRSKTRLSLPGDAPNRLRVLLDFLLATRPGTRNEVFRWTDPLPAFRETYEWFLRR